MLNKQLYYNKLMLIKETEMVKLSILGPQTLGHISKNIRYQEYLI